LPLAFIGIVFCTSGIGIGGGIDGIHGINGISGINGII
jgi:hypothetical protein